MILSVTMTILTLLLLEDLKGLFVGVFFFHFCFSKIDSTKFFIVCLHFRLRRRSGQRSGDSYNSLDFKTAPQSLQSPQSFQ